MNLLIFGEFIALWPVKVELAKLSILASSTALENLGPYAMNFQNNAESTPHIFIKPGKSIERTGLPPPYDQAVSLAEGKLLKSEIFWLIKLKNFNSHAGGVSYRLCWRVVPVKTI